MAMSNVTSAFHGLELGPKTGSIAQGPGVQCEQLAKLFTKVYEVEKSVVPGHMAESANRICHLYLHTLQVFAGQTVPQCVQSVRNIYSEARKTLRTMCLSYSSKQLPEWRRPGIECLPLHQPSQLLRQFQCIL